MIKSKQKEQALARRKAALALVPKNGESTGVMAVFERLAKDPKLTVDKLGKLIELQKDIMAVNAKAAFDRDYDAMVLEVPIISRRGKVLNKAGGVQSRYSKFEDIQKVIKPLAKRFGFHQGFRTEWPETLVCEVVGTLHHREGHVRESRFRSASDASGGKNAIQGLGSAVSYGKRYVTIDLFNIVCEGVDDDGQKAGRQQQDEPQAPRQSAAQTDGTGDQPITSFVRGEGTDRQVGQVQRLMTIMSRCGRTKPEVKAWLKARYNIESSKDIPRRLYEEICSAVEKPGPLPLAGPLPASQIFREPGQEG